MIFPHEGLSNKPVDSNLVESIKIITDELSIIASFSNTGSVTSRLAVSGPPCSSNFSNHFIHNKQLTTIIGERQHESQS